MNVNTHIVAPYQDKYGASDRLQRREHIRGFLGNLHSHPCRGIRRPPRRPPSRNNTSIGRCVLDVGERGRSTEGDGG